MKDLKGVKVNGELIADLEKKVDVSQYKTWVDDDDNSIDFNFGVKTLFSEEGPAINLYCAKKEFMSSLDLYKSIYSGDLENAKLNQSSYVSVGPTDIALSIIPKDFDFLYDSNLDAYGLSIHRDKEDIKITLSTEVNKVELDKTGFKLVEEGLSSYGSTTDIYHTVLTTANGRALIPGEIEIPYTYHESNETITVNDLNNVKLLKVGSYYCSSASKAQSLTNCPTTDPFTMEVFSPISKVVDDEATARNVARLRIITTYLGEQYVQSCSSGSAAGEFTYGEWRKVGSGEVSGTTITVGSDPVDSLTFTSDPQTQIDTIKSTYLPLVGGKTITGTLGVEGDTSLKNTVIDGKLTINGNIYLNGDSYITHAEELKIADDYIILRNGENVPALTDTEYSGLEFHHYNNAGDDLRLVVGNDGVARIGDKTGVLQALATREDKPNANALAYWDSATNSFKTDETLTTTTIAKSSDLTNYATTSALNAVKTTADSAVQTITGSNGVSASKNGTGVTVSGVNATQSASGMMSAADKKSFDRELRSLIPKGSSIPANADLNTITYLKVGSYYCISIDNAKTIKNCPTQNAFILEVFSLINKTYDNETTSWCYRYRLLTTYKGEQYWQFCQTKDTAGVWTYNDWNKVPAMSDLSKYLPLTGGTMKGELRVNGGDAAGASKIVLETNKGQITNSSTGTLFGYTGTNLLSVGHNSVALQLRGSGSRPTYNGTNIALSSDIPSLSNYVDKTNPQEISGLKTFKTSLKIGDCTITYNSTVKALEISVQ